MIKNMMGMLMEDLTNKWSGARKMVQSIRICLTRNDEKLNNLEAKFSWRHYTIARNVEEMVGCGNEEKHDMVGETLEAVENSTALEQENQDNTQLTTPVTISPQQVKRVREELNINIASQPLQEL